MAKETEANTFIHLLIHLTFFVVVVVVVVVGETPQLKTF